MALNSQAQTDMDLAPSPPGLDLEYQTIFSTGSLVFLQELISTFDEEVDRVTLILYYS